MDKPKIVVATSNEGKLKEIGEILSDYQILSIKDFDLNIDILEDAETFEGNALKKATELSKILKIACIADDSGICIKALNGFPGIYTARWMSGTAKEHNIKILEKMQNIPKSERQCSFVTAIALVDTTKSISIVKVHTLNGSISTEIRGENGFGFDQIFELENGKTLGELSSEEKNVLSPRRFALEEIRKEL